MKKQLLGLSVLAAFLSTSALAAGPIANIEVTGDIKPPTCTVNSGNNELLYNLGTVSPALIPQNTHYNGLPSVSNLLSVACDADTYLTFKATDTYHQTAIIPNGYNNPHRLAVTFTLVESENTDNVIGGTAFNMLSPTVDGVAVNISRGNDGLDTAASAHWGDSSRIQIGSTMAWTYTAKDVAPIDTMDFVAGKVFTSVIGISTDRDNNGSNTYILSKNQLSDQNIDLSQGVNYIGEAVLAFNFGI